MSKKGVFETKVCIFYFCFLCWRKKREIMKKWKMQISKTPRPIVFLGACEQKCFLVKIALFRKIGKHYCFRKEKKRHFHCNYLFFENGPFLCPFKITKHYKNRVFSSKAGFTICDPRQLCCAENTIFIVFSAKTQICRNKKCKLKNNRKIGGCLPTRKKVFFLCYSFVFFFSVV